MGYMKFPPLVSHSPQCGVRSFFRTMAEPPFESTCHKLGPCSIQNAKFSFPNPSTTAGALHKQLPSLKGEFNRLIPE